MMSGINSIHFSYSPVLATPPIVAIRHGVIQEDDMSVQTTPTTVQTGLTGLGLAEAGWHLRAAVRALRKGAKEAWRRRRTRADLAELDARLLRDIGVTRLDAAAESRKPFWMP